MARARVYKLDNKVAIITLKKKGKNIEALYIERRRI